MAAQVKAEAFVAKIKGGRIYLKCDLIPGREVILSASADDQKVTGGLTFTEGQTVMVLVDGNIISLIWPR